MSLLTQLILARKSWVRHELRRQTIRRRLRPFLLLLVLGLCVVAVDQCGSGAAYLAQKVASGAARLAPASYLSHLAGLIERQ